MPSIFRPKRDTDFQVGIWGSTGSGKTTYLASLYQALEASSKWTISTAFDQSGQAHDFIVTNLDKLQRGEFPEPTPPQTNEWPRYRYTIEPRNSTESGHSWWPLKRGPTKIHLDFVDAPGEFYEKIPDGVAQALVEGGETILEYLSQCHGIIFLLDPEYDENQQGAKRYETLLRDLLKRFQDYSRELGMIPEQYMAFCITKVDEKNKYWDKRDLPKELVEQVVGGKNGYKRIFNNYCQAGRFKFYATSCVGRYKDNAENDTINVSERSISQESDRNTTDIWSEPWQSSSTPGEKYIIIPEFVTLLNILEPLEWLITNIQQKPPRLVSKA